MSLLQYKAEFYGRKTYLLPDLDRPVRIDCETQGESYIHFKNASVTSEPWRHSARYLARRGGAYTNKFILLPLDKVYLRHKYAYLSKTFLLVQTQDPNETDLLVRPIQIWVREEWTEPLTKNLNYENETKENALNSLKEIWAAREKK